MRALQFAFVALAGLALSGCGYNSLQSQDEAVKSAWSEVVNQYQRRADLVPNLVATVKGFAQQEQTVLLGVTEARAKVGSLNVTPEVLNDPAAFQQHTPDAGVRDHVAEAGVRVLEHIVHQQPGVDLLGDAAQPAGVLEPRLKRLAQRRQRRRQVIQ